MNLSSKPQLKQARLIRSQSIVQDRNLSAPDRSIVILVIGNFHSKTVGLLGDKDEVLIKKMIVYKDYGLS